MLCGHDGELRRYLHLGERGEWRRGRCDLVFSVVWLSKNWRRWAVFAFFCGDCPVFSTPMKAKATLPTKLGWSGARAVVVVVV